MRRVACTLTIALLWGATAPAEPSDPAVEEVRACVARNLPSEDSVQKVRFTSLDRTGSERVLEAKVYWKRFKNERSRTLIEVEAPENVRGSAYLILEEEGREDMFVYLPEFKKVRRIHPNTASGSLFGTDLSYEDIRYMRRVAGELEGKREPDSTLDGRAVYVVRMKPTGQEVSRYERIDAFIDRQDCVPLKIDFYESGERLAKELTADPSSLRQEPGGQWIARSMAMRNIADETETRMVVEDVKIDTDLSKAFFSVEHLGHGH
jgi:outer membrane lipoprotein-sorting protein